MALIQLSTLQDREPVEGCRARFVHSDNVTIAYWNIDAGASIPEHSHPHEQVVNMVEGEFELTVDGIKHALAPGLVVVIPPNAPHEGTAITECRIIDVFHPVREDYR
jgi:quercetin dioxygenase-like cupin family protein